jgi:diguanylate cyclase (GGDEF)-like protein
VLIETANLVQGILRLSDQLGRWGGEEFLVVAPQTNSAQACRLAERLRMTLALHSHKDVGIVTASFGVSEYRAGESQQAWLNRADERMFTAKQSGRNRIA